MSSINLNNSKRSFFKFGIIEPISWIEKYIVAYVKAAEIPIASPSSWKKYKFPQSKLLFVSSNLLHLVQL